MIIDDVAYRVGFDVLAWGDFDGDGIDDVLLFRWNRALGGTLAYYSHVVLTKKSPSARLTVVPYR